MTDSALACPDCQQPHDATDNYCRNCGMFLAATKDVAVLDRALPVRRPRAPSLPVPVRRAVAAVAVGAAVQVGVSLAGKYLLRQAARQALSVPGKARSEATGRQLVKERGSSVPDDVTAVNETVVVHRAWIRR